MLQLSVGLRFERTVLAALFVSQTQHAVGSFYYYIYSPKLITAVSFAPPQSNGSHPSRT